MNAALIFAGGTGQRMKSGTKPKQFLELYGKPIIIYTLELFENNENIDGIVVACLESWIPYLEKLLDKFQIKKVKAIVPGGDSGQASIRNGINKLAEIYPEDTVVLIHDGVRPLITVQTITDNIEMVKKYGNCITTAPAIETIALKTDTELVGDIIDRSKAVMARAPQSFYLKDIKKAHDNAVAEGKENFIDSASMMRYYGHDLHIVVGPSENIKITTPTDFYCFRAITDSRENSQIFG